MCSDQLPALHHAFWLFNPFQTALFSVPAMANEPKEFQKASNNGVVSMKERCHLGGPADEKATTTLLYRHYWNIFRAGL